MNAPILLSWLVATTIDPSTDVSFRVPTPEERAALEATATHHSAFNSFTRFARDDAEDPDVFFTTMDDVGDGPQAYFRDVFVAGETFTSNPDDGDSWTAQAVRPDGSTTGSSGSINVQTPAGRATIDARICADGPQVLQRSATHFVTALGRDLAATHFIVNDPSSEEFEAPFSGPALSGRFFAGPSIVITNEWGISITAWSPVELLLTDPSGRRAAIQAHH